MSLIARATNPSTVAVASRPAPTVNATRTPADDPGGEAGVIGTAGEGLGDGDGDGDGDGEGDGDGDGEGDGEGEGNSNGIGEGDFTSTTGGFGVGFGVAGGGFGDGDGVGDDAGDGMGVADGVGGVVGNDMDGRGAGAAEATARGDCTVASPAWTESAVPPKTAQTPATAMTARAPLRNLSVTVRSLRGPSEAKQLRIAAKIKLEGAYQWGSDRQMTQAVVPGGALRSE